MVSCSLRGDLADLGDVFDSDKSFIPDGDFTELERNELLRDGDLNCSKITSSGFGRSCSCSSGKDFLFFSGVRIAGCEQCFFGGESTGSFFSFDSIDLIRSERCLPD